MYSLDRNPFFIGLFWTKALGQKSTSTGCLRPRHPEGEEGVDELIVRGDDNRLYVCPASALAAALDLDSFRRAATATTR